MSQPTNHGQLGKQPNDDQENLNNHYFFWHSKYHGKCLKMCIMILQFALILLKSIFIYTMVKRVSQISSPTFDPDIKSGHSENPN